MDFPVGDCHGAVVRCGAPIKSYPATAERNVPKPSIGRVMRLTAPWSRSTMLFGYFDWCISMCRPLSARVLVIATVFARLVDDDLLVLWGRPVWRAKVDSGSIPPVDADENQSAARS